MSLNMTYTLSCDRCKADYTVTEYVDLVQGAPLPEHIARRTMLGADLCTECEKDLNAALKKSGFYLLGKEAPC